MNTSYEFAEIEQAAQDYWEDNESFCAKEDLNREKYYCLSMLPYPSGDLHVGHVRNYTLGDAITRYQRLLGKNVLQPMGWDAFGLPAENAAIKRKLPPAEWTEKNIKRMRKQLQQLGYAFDWRRELATCDPTYYQWEQWLFLKLYKKGLAYKKNSVVNWDPVDNTVLANEQVIDGKGWRSGATVEQREISQWFLKITDYAQQLLESLDELTGWPEQVVQMQRNWIGRSEGVSIKFKLVRYKGDIEVFTTRADTLMGATYLAIAPEHPLSLRAAEKSPEIKKFIQQCKKCRVAEADLAKQEKLGIDSGIKVIHPLTQEKIPVWIANYVLMEYGEGAVMCVPAHDERDFAFAKKYQLPCQQVISPNDNSDWDIEKAPLLTYGKLINSGEFDKLSSETAITKITNHLKKAGGAEKVVKYRLRDWGISRQRYWGAPIPIIYCKHCGEVPVPEDQLPVVLPTDLVPDGSASPLTKEPKFYKTKCPECGKAAKRETDTFDTFMESSWYYARYCCNDQDKAMLDDRAKYWTPVDQYVGGIEHAVLHLLYARFMHKLLRDEGLLNSNEPFKCLLTQGMVLKDGVKMSKNKGNTVPPQPLIKKFGADTVRLFILFASPPEQTLEWSDQGVEGAHRFLKKLWQFCQTHETLFKEYNLATKELLTDIDNETLSACYCQVHSILDQADNDTQKLQFNTVVSAAMKLLNLLNKIEANNDTACALIYEATSILLRLLHPIAPHITHYLWQELAFGDDIMKSQWPKVNPKALYTNTIELVVQVNGKLRGHIKINNEENNEIIEASALEHENVKRIVGDKKVKKIVIVPKKLVNIVI